jgi:hypothetical protein
MDMSVELTTMDIPRYRMGRQWMREYHRHFPISAPEVGFLPVKLVVDFFVCSSDCLFISEFEISVLAMLYCATLFGIHHAFRKKQWETWVS